MGEANGRDRAWVLLILVLLCTWSRGPEAEPETLEGFQEGKGETMKKGKGETMKSCDFRRSFITFVTPGRSNHARIQVEARCELTDLKTGQMENFYLVASCKGEDTYGTGRLFLVPSYDFCIIYSSKDFMILRTYSNAERDNTTVGDHQGYFLEVRFHIEMVGAKVLEDNAAVVKATLSNCPLNGRTEITDEAGHYRAMIESPIKTMNVNDLQNIYQVDTGPILLPNFHSTKERLVERFQLAYVAYNNPEEAYFVIQEPTPIVEGSPHRISFYSRVTRMNAKNSVWLLR